MGAHAARPQAAVRAPCKAARCDAGHTVPPARRQPRRNQRHARLRARSCQAICYRLAPLLAGCRVGNVTFPPRRAARPVHTPGATRAGSTGQRQAPLVVARWTARAARDRAKNSGVRVLSSPGSSAPAFPYPCGRSSVRRWQACNCATDMCNTQAFDVTSRNVDRRTYPLCDTDCHVQRWPSADTSRGTPEE
jgi:hypothetical protein